LFFEPRACLKWYKVFLIYLFALSFGQQSKNLKQNYDTVSDEIEMLKMRETSAAKYSYKSEP